MHPYVAEDWAPRLVAAGLLYEIRNSDDKIVRYINGDPDIPDVADSEREIENLLSEMETFVRAGISQEVEIGGFDIKAEIFNRIKTMVFHSNFSGVDVSSTNTTTLNLKSTVEKEKSISNVVATKEDRVGFYCAKFAAELKDRDSERFEVFMRAATGALVTEVVLSLKVPPEKGQRAEGLTVFLDSPIVIDLLRLGEAKECEYAQELIAELVSIGASLATFQVNVEEVRGVLVGVLSARERGDVVGRGIGRRLSSDSMAVARLRATIQSLADKVADLGICIVNFDEEHSDLYKHFEVAREDDLFAQIRPFGHSSIGSRTTDARALANIIRLTAAAQKSPSILKASSVFLTKNAPLAAKGMEICRREQIISEGQAPPILSDRFMAGVVWVAKGGVGSDVPASRMMAACAAAMAPRADVISRMVKVLNSIGEREAEEFEALMTDERCANYLAELSLGGTRIINEDNAVEILEEIRAETAYATTIQKDLEKAEALAAQQGRFEKIIEQRDAQFAESQKAIRETISVADQAKRELEKEQEQRHEIEVKSLLVDVRFVRLVGRIIAFIYYLSISVVIAVIHFFASGLANGASPSANEIIAYVFLIAVALAIGVLLFNRVPDFFLARWIPKVQEKILRRRLRKKGGESLLDFYLVDYAKGTVSDK